MLGQEKPQDFELIELLIREAGLNVASTSTQQGSGFESFKARFQSYIDQIPSYLHSVGKEGFFPHFFLGSFSTLVDTEIAKKLDIEKICFSFDSSKTLKVAIIKKEEIKSPEDVADKVKLFVIAESGSARKKFSYSELDKILGNTKVARNDLVRRARDQGKLGVRLVEITKEKDAKGKMAGISVNVESNKLDNDASTIHEFKEIKKGLWNNPESDIAKLTNSDAGKVKESIEEILKKVSKIHSEYKNSLIYGKEVREAAHHGFIAGALVNFRYRHNLRVYLEQFAGRGYADIVLVPRGEKRALDAIPIIIEMKAATKEELKELEKGGKTKDGSQTTPAVALKQAEDYTKGFQPNVMRVLTTANDILCVGVNLDYPSAISDIATKSRDQKITPLFNNILESIDKQNNGEITQEQLKTQIQENIERIYHTFPGTGEKGDGHYFSRFLSGQSILLDKALKIQFKKYIFIPNVVTYAKFCNLLLDACDQISKPEISKIVRNLMKEVESVDLGLIDPEIVDIVRKIKEENGKDVETIKNIIEKDGVKEKIKKVLKNENIPTEALRPSKQPPRTAAPKKEIDPDPSYAVVTMVFIPEEGSKKLTYVMNIVEADGRAEVVSKGIPLDKLKQEIGNRKIVELNLNFNIKKQKSDFKEYFSMEVGEPISLEQYSNKKTDKFKGNFENVPYPAKLKETFDKVLEFQLASSQDQSQSIGKYKELFGKLGEAVLPFKVLIEREAHTQAVFHGAFSHYSDIKLGESQENSDIKLGKSQENRALVLTEFQTGRGKRIDMVVHGISTDKDGNAKEYDPVGLELKGPREGKTADALKDEANKQIADEYTKGVTYKTLTDGKEVDFVGVVFDKSASSADSLILMSKDEFASVKVVHSSIMQIGQQQPKKKFNPDLCVKDGDRSRRSVNFCLFSKNDVEKFSKGKVDENNVDKVIIDSEKFLIYVKSSQDEAKNAQLVEFVRGKSIEGDRKYLLDKVIEDQGYERYVQIERVKNLHGDISQKTGSTTKSSKLKNRLINAAGGIQLIRGIHGAIVSCKEGTATDCGLNLGGIAWSFASQPIENVMVKITPKVVASAEKVVGKIIPGTLGKQTKFAIRIAGVKFGGAIARGTAGAITGVFDIVDISMSASNLVDCKKREDSDNPCGEKEIRDNIASISFSSVSFISGVALAAASMPVIGTAVGFGLMVGYGVYSGVSNIVEYKKKYDTTHGENWSIFWHTLFSQPMPLDIQILEARSRVVNSVAKEAWRALNSRTDGVVAYAVGFGDMIKKVSVDCRPSGPCTCDTNQFGVGFYKKCDLIEIAYRAGHTVIAMDKESDTNMKNLSRVTPDSIPGASMICLPQITTQDYEKGITNSVSSAKYYCDNAMVISHNNRVKMKREDKTIVYDLQNVNRGTIVGSNVWNNNFLIHSGTERITGGNKVVNRFVVNNIDFSGEIIGGSNSTNILDLSQLTEDKVTGVIDYRFKPSASGSLKARVNGHWLINDQIDSNGIFNYYYVGRRNKVDEVLCMGYFEHFTGNDSRDVIINSGGGSNNNEKDVVENCRKVIISPYTAVRGRKSNYTFYVKTADYKGRNLYSEIDVNGTGTVIFSEIDLLGDCDQITYSTSSNTLSLKINVGQNNQFTLDIKNYVEQSSNKPHFVLIDKNGSNIVPKIERSDSPIIEIKSFELYSEHSLDNFDDVESHYEKILNNHKSYKVFGVIRDEVQDQDNSTVPHMVFGSSGDDIINFDQGTMVAKGRDGSDIYIINGDVRKREVIIDNNSDDKELDTVFVQEVPKEFLVQKCDLHLNYNSTNIQVKNYFQNDSYKHLMVMNSKGETFIPYVQSMSCSSMGNGKLVPFFHVTQTQNMFMLPKDFQDDHVVIDSRLEDIARYRDKDNLLLVGNGEVPFIVRVEDFYNDQSRWRDVNFFLWNNGNFSPYFGLQQEVDRVTDYQDKLKNDYEKTIKEYVIDFTKSINITHNQNDTLNSIEEDEKRIGVMILKDITPDRVEVFSSSADLIFRDKKSNRTVNIKSWNNNESYRISTLEFDLGLEPMIIRRLGRFSLSEVREIQALIDKASENYQNKGTYTPKIENDFKCLISMDGFENTNPTYKCLGFSSLQDQISFTENLCSKGQIEEFRGKIPNNIQVLSLLIKLHNDLLLSSYNQSTIDQCNYLMITSELEVSKLLHLAANNNDLNRIKFLLDNGANVEVKDNDGRTLLNVAACNGNLDMNQFIFDRIEAKSNDPSKMIKLIKSLKEEIISQANIQSDVKEWAESRVSDLRNSIKDVAVKRLKDGMVNDRYTSTIELAKEIYIFENKLFSDVIKEVINNVYGKVDTEKILNFIHSHDQIEQKAYGYVAVFEKMESKNNLNDNAVFKLAYYVKEIIDSGRRSDLESLKNRLPESLKNVMFSSVVCIKNVEYGRYLYSPNNDCMYHLNNCDRDRRYVFTWPSNGNNDQFKWRVEFNGNNVYLKNVAYGRYLYSPNDDCTYHLNDCDSDRRYAFTWPSNRGGSNFKWKVELNGDNVYLKNVAYGRYLYSPNDDCTYHLNNCDRDRRYVFTWKSGERVTNGVWKIEDCGFNIKKRDVINQSADIKARDNNGETSLHTAIQYSNTFNANVGFHSDIVRVSRQAKSNSEISVYYIKGVEDESRHVQINLASSVKATGKFQGLANKIVLNQEAISHLNKVRKVSGILMHGMIAKNALADFLNGDYKGVAINLGFIGGGQGLAKIAKAANAKGVGLITEGKLLLGRSLKAASPFLSRSTSAFVVYDLVNQIKELESGDKDALIPVIGDSIYLGIDAAEVGIEVAEVFGALEGVSSVTGPIGTAIGTVVFIGTDIYMAIKRVGKIDEIVHLTSGERFIEGLRAFVGMKPEQYIGKLMGEKQANDQLVRQGLKYLKQHNDIQRYVFPTGKLVEDNDRCITVTERGPCTGMIMCSPSITEKVQCQEKIQVDLDSVALFDKKVDNVIYSRAKPDAPNEGKLFCLPTGSKRSDSKGENAYFCYNAIGLSCSANRTGNYTFIDLGEGNDVSRGFIDSPNIFVVNNGFKQYYGGNKDDRFILQGNFIEGNINGGDGVDTVDLDEFASEVRSIQAKLGRSGYVSYNNSSFEMENINKISARKDKSDTITCDYNTKYVDGRGGESYDNPDIITILKNSDFHEMQLIVRPSTNITNHAYNGDFNYTILSGKGRAQINLSNLLGGTPTDRHNFFFNYTLSELININIRNISRVPYYNYTIREAVFSFSSPLSQNKSINEKFNVTISGIPANASYVLSDNTEIKIGKNNLYAIHNTNKTIDEIVKSYPAVADHLRMSLFVNTNNETVVIGHGNHDVISNNFLQRSHLIGSGGENVYVITSGYEILDIENLPIPEVIVYDDFNKKESLKDTLDLRQLVQQVNSDLSIEPISNVIKDENDILIKLSISATGLQQDVATVRLKDAFANNWYKELQIILNSVPVKIDDDLDLKPLPLTFNKEIVVVTPQDVEEKDKLIISKEAGQYTFLHSGYDLIITNAFNADIETNKLCTIYFKDFYKESKMETLSIKFTDKEILLSDEMDKINNADSISDKLNINDYISSIVKLQESSEPSEAASSNHPIRHRRHKNNSRREDGVHHVRHKHHKVQEHNNNYQNNRYYIDQPEITTSSGARPSSWINDLFGWVKSSIGGLLSSALSKETSSTPSPISQVDAKMDVNGTIMLLDVIVRKFTGKQYIPAVDQSIPLLEARGYALNITNRFEKVLNKTAIKSGISVTNLNFDPVVVQSAIIGKIINGKFSEIAKTLYSIAKEACPEFKQTDKFLAHLKSNLEGEKETALLQQKIDKPSEVLDQQVSRKVELLKRPNTFLNGTSVVKGISNVLEL